MDKIDVNVAGLDQDGYTIKLYGVVSVCVQYVRNTNVVNCRPI